jgi:deoxycytidylate deaminase
LIISCGIKRVVAESKYYAWSETEAMFKEGWIELIYFDETLKK